jgi:hypothetical protein
VSPLKIKIPIKNLGRQLCAEEFNSGVKWIILLAHFIHRIFGTGAFYRNCFQFLVFLFESRLFQSSLNHFTPATRFSYLFDLWNYLTPDLLRCSWTQLFPYPRPQRTPIVRNTPLPFSFPPFLNFPVVTTIVDTPNCRSS